MNQKLFRLKVFHLFDMIEVYIAKHRIIPATIFLHPDNYFEIHEKFGGYLYYSDEPDLVEKQLRAGASFLRNKFNGRKIRLFLTEDILPHTVKVVGYDTCEA